ncbi:MAG: BlaI/MecI/CopY family transcriptional regulator [Planctomycetaceae bacterium]
MARPRHKHPTPAELEVLKILWDRGPSTVRGVLGVFAATGHRRAYTTVMSLMNVMVEKSLLRRRRRGRAFLYEARLPQEKTLRTMVGDLWERAFEGSTELLLSRLLEQANPSPQELDEIRRVIDDYRNQTAGREERK